MNITLEKALKSGKVTHKIVKINPLQTIDFNDVPLVDLLGLKVSAVFDLFQQCASFENNAPLPANVAGRLDILDLPRICDAIYSRLKEINVYPKKSTKKEKPNQEIKLIKPLVFDKKMHTHIKINRPSPADLMELSMPRVLLKYGNEMIKLIQKCGKFEDGSEIPEGFEIKLHPENFIQCVGELSFFFQGLDKIQTSEN